MRQRRLIGLLIAFLRELKVWNIEHTKFVFGGYNRLDRGTDISSVYIGEIFQKTTCWKWTESREPSMPGKHQPVVSESSMHTPHLMLSVEQCSLSGHICICGILGVRNVSDNGGEDKEGL